MSFILGFIFSILLYMCIVMEITRKSRWLFSVIFLGGIFGGIFQLFSNNMIPDVLLFVSAFLINTIAFIAISPIFSSNGEKKKEEVQ